MASHDVRDVLDLPADGAGPRPAKKLKTAAPRPNLKGLAREVQNLGGDNPIAIVPAISSFKKRRFGSRKPVAKWEMRPFRNSARGDGSLTLAHWRRKEDGKPVHQTEHQDGQPTEDQMETDQRPKDVEDSSFAKFNVKVHVPQYSEDQYNSTLTSNDWTKDETDYLMETVRDFELRWPLIWDRYDYQPKPLETAEGGGGTDGTNPGTAVVPVHKARSVEDLKARYYDVAAKMMAVQKPVQYMNATEFSLHQTMSDFNPVDEARRKKFAESMMSRSKEEAREEESLLIEVRRIWARTEKFNQERRELYNRLDYPHTETTQDLSVFKTSNGLQTLLQNLMSVDKSKKRKSLMGTDGQNTPASAGPSGHPGSTLISEVRRESIAASTTSGHRDSIGASDGRPEKPTKKGAQQAERPKLTEQEKEIYGVSQPDERLPTGPTFRYDKINKILTTKSNAQHQRITNTLAELDIPGRLNMPTKDVVNQMAKLLEQINILLDIRKISDKYDGELKLEQAKKAHKSGLKGPAQSDSKPQGSGSDAAKAVGVNGDGNSEAVSSATAAATSTAASSGTDRAGASTDGTQPPTNGRSTANLDAMNVDKSTDDATKVKQEAMEEKMARPASSGGHKRSASVLSTISDKSAKRQKK
ncbi:SWR1-complex protein 4 [Xylariales sp. AK1849]|nr:SWR1-complex protein 4 [Xylariales sp. AK1849]